MTFQLALHLTALAGVTLLALCLVARAPGFADRSLTDLVLPLIPFLGLGLVSALLLSASGTPFLEWLLPALGVLVLGVFCRSERAFRAAWPVLATVAAFLCMDYLALMHGGGYAGAFRLQQAAIRAQQESTLRGAQERLWESFRPTEVLPPGPVARILGDRRYEFVPTTSVRRSWYTPLTGLYRVDRGKALLWYPGGPVREGSRHLELRPDRGRG